MLGALGVHGLQAVMTVDGATDADVFRTYVKRVLGPMLAPRDLLVMDNLRAHKAVGVQQSLARRRARLLYLPPYSPDLSPIEPCWSKVKAGLRKAKARFREALDSAITDVLATVTADPDDRHATCDVSATVSCTSTRRAAHGVWSRRPGVPGTPSTAL
jgi:transposase